MGLAELRGALENVAAQAEGCDVFLVGESRGLLHVFLSELGFRTWRSEGTLIEQLENVSLKDAETLSSRNSACHSLSYGIAVAGHPEIIWMHRDGILWLLAGQCLFHYALEIPLMDITGSILLKSLAMNQTLISKQVLLPFLTKYEFQKLEISCDHLPKWLANEIDQLNFRMEFGTTGSSFKEMKVMIFPGN